MAPCESEPASTVRPLKSPRHVLELALLNRLTHIRIAFMGPVTPVHRAGRSHGVKNRDHALHAVTETHVKIPFIPNLKRAHTPRHGVVRKGAEIGHPNRVNRPVQFEAAANPIKELTFTSLFGRFHRVMKAAKANPLLH